MSKVTVIDYGIGNLLSVCRAFEFCGAEVLLTDSPLGIEKADRVVLPGVGAFADGMYGLKKRGLVKAIQKYSQTGRPFLGICLGMQLMMDVSEEFGVHEGLGIIPGKVTAIPDTGVNNERHKIPHIGWNSLLLPPSRDDWMGTILENVNVGEYAYFVHSYSVITPNHEQRLADCLYNGRQITAAIQSGTIYGCQFHPEKSGEVGLSIIKRFFELV